MEYDYYFSQSEYEWQRGQYMKGIKNVHIHRCFFQGKEYTKMVRHGTPFDGFPIDSKLIGTGRANKETISSKPYNKL